MKKDSPSLQLYRQLLRLYPSRYRERFAAEMLEVFRQCHEEAARRPHGSTALWASVLRELPSNLIYEHFNGKETMQHPYKLTSALAGALLAPFLAFILIAMAGHVLGQPWNAQVGQFLLTYRLGTLLLVVFPVLAAVASLLSLVGRPRPSGQGVFTVAYAKANWMAIGLLVVSVGLALFVPFHDSGACLREFASSPNAHQLQACVRNS